MSDDCRCDNCGAMGRRRRWTMAPPGWLFMEVEADDDGELEIFVLWACKEACALALWKKGPGRLTVDSKKDDSAEPAFPSTTTLPNGTTKDRSACDT